MVYRLNIVLHGVDNIFFPENYLADKVAWKRLDDNEKFSDISFTIAAMFHSLGLYDAIKREYDWPEALELNVNYHPMGNDDNIFKSSFPRLDITPVDEEISLDYDTLKIVPKEFRDTRNFTSLCYEHLNVLLNYLPK